MSRPTPLFGCLLVAALLLALPGSAARADGEDAARPWSFDVRVVQVRASADQGFAAAPFPSGRVADFDFRQALKTLAPRGDGVSVLMDQRLTTVDGVSATASNEHSLPVERFDTADNNLRRVRFDSLKWGSKVQLVPVETELRYEISANWLYWPTLKTPVPVGRTQWFGTQGDLAPGQTLVLHAREHVVAEDKTPRVAEIYCFITAAAR